VKLELDAEKAFDKFLHERKKRSEESEASDEEADLLDEEKDNA
jgi:hypothetical protein